MLHKFTHPGTPTRFQIKYCIKVEKFILKLIEEKNYPRSLSIKLRRFETEDGNEIRKSNVSKLNQFTCIELRGMRSFKQLYGTPLIPFVISQFVQQLNSN
jgi:hypothetical protein